MSGSDSFVGDCETEGPMHVVLRSSILAWDKRYEDQTCTVFILWPVVHPLFEFFISETGFSFCDVEVSC